MLGGFLGEGISIAVGRVIKVRLIGVQRRVLVEPINCAVKRVRAALADYVDLTAGGAAEAGVIVGDTYPKLVGAFDSDGNDGDLVTASGDDVIGDVDAVEIEGVLVAAGAGNSTARVA